MKLRRGQCCNYCQRKLGPIGSHGKLAPTRDHVFPKSKMTPFDRTNGVLMVWACRQCNMLKSNMLPREWSEFMRKNPEWWRRPEWQHGSNVKADARLQSAGH